MKKLKHSSASLWATLLALTSVSANTQHIFDPNVVQKDYGYNYKELNNVETNVSTHTTELFGDTIDPASGVIYAFRKLMCQSPATLTFQLGLPEL